MDSLGFRARKLQRRSELGGSLEGTEKDRSIGRAPWWAKFASQPPAPYLLKPRIGWQLTANAKTFDPGALVAGWPGKLGFALDTQGELQEKGPNASLNLKDLNGTLRGRPIAGRAALTVNPQKVVAGTLNVSSGKSSVSVDGRAGQSMDVDTQFDVASLETGCRKPRAAVHGKFHITGAWPKLAIEGGAQGRDIALRRILGEDRRREGGRAQPAIARRLGEHQRQDDHRGGLRVLRDRLRCVGQRESAQGASQSDRPAAERRTACARRARRHRRLGGHGRSARHRAPPASRLSLREPTKVTFNPRAFSVSQSCLAGEQISACISAAQDESGELNAKYTLEHLPLGLIAALAMPDLPLRIEAVIEGNGDIRRTKEGTLFGEAHISSTSGRVSEADEPRLRKMRPTRCSPTRT